MIAQAGLVENKAQPLPGTGLGSRDQGENQLQEPKQLAHGSPTGRKGQQAGIASQGSLSIPRQPSQV